MKRSRAYDQALKLAQARETPPRRAYDLLLKADAEGDLRATYALATWYLHGSPFTKVDRTKAVRLLRAAAAEVSDAAYDLAVSYEKGAGARKSLPRAFQHYMQAALLGDSQAHHEVGRMYFHGLGVARNCRLAEMWLSKAESMGVTD